MPSDAKKRKDAAKKQAVKKKQDLKHGAKIDENGEANGEDDGSATATSASNTAASSVNISRVGTAVGSLSGVDMSAIEDAFERIEIQNAAARSCTGVLASHPQSRDLKVGLCVAMELVDSVTLTFYGREILVDSCVEFNNGRRYGLVGLNGCGKSCFLQALANREFPMPDSMDLFLLTREIGPSEKSALQTVIDVDAERIRLEHEAEQLAVIETDEAHEALMDVYARLEEMDADSAEVRAADILHGLGFNKHMQHKRCKDFSGGWRMRIALARCLFVKPCLLLLDEPTNHLDLDACVWLEEELKCYNRILVVVSHSQDFMNGVCTNIIHFFQQKLVYYTGNYDQFIKTRIELVERQAKQYNWEQAQLQHMKDYVARFGHGSAKLARQAQSKEKTMAKMIAGGLTEKVSKETVKAFHFFDCGSIPPPVIMVQNVSFRYSDNTPWIYKNLEFGIDLDTRIALVGPNGAGKSTLLKLLGADLQPSDGIIRRHSHVKLGLYHQHLGEKLDLDLNALEYMMKEFPDVTEREQMRRIVGRYGLTGREQTCPMRQLSDGQRCRVSFAWLAWQTPHLLLLDEPTNHLDMESIDALADAINAFEGGMILVSHDFRLVHQVTDEIWVCNNLTCTKWEGDIFSYKEALRKDIEHDRKRRAKLNLK